MIIDRLRRAIPRFVAVLSVSCFGATAFAQAPVDWAVLGASASTIINTGQTFIDIGTTLGRADLVGVDLTVSYSGIGLGGDKVLINESSVSDDEWSIFRGTLSFTFSSPVEVRFEGGGSLLSGEIDSFGPAGVGSLISSHPQVGLTVTDDSVGNLTNNNIVTPTLKWVGGPAFNFTHDVVAHNERGSLYILVPEPSTFILAALGLIALGCRRWKRA